jgi:hypothetical protein
VPAPASHGGRCDVGQQKYGGFMGDMASLMMFNGYLEVMAKLFEYG